MINLGSRMDEVIFTEFEGMGNSEIILHCTKLAENCSYLAINIVASGTCKEEQLVECGKYVKMWVLQWILSCPNGPCGRDHGAPAIVEKLWMSKSIDDFFLSMNQY